MDVYLLIYDLSGGLARQLSMQLIGRQLDAIYHTSIELNGMEYVYDGGIATIRPGSSHLGQPLQRQLLGTTQLPLDVIAEYLESLRSIFTVEAYDLWRHNCNNFSNDFATFLLGRGIPEHIVNMPSEVLESPMGRMLMPALDQQVQARKQQQQQNGGGVWGVQGSGQPSSSGTRPAPRHPSGGRVREASNLRELDALLAEAQRSCAVVFFTSATCPPCKMLYPVYQQLAEEVGARGVVIKTDISIARDVAARYSIRATPTFITFLKGEQENTWMGADPGELSGNVRLLVTMAWPPHHHRSLHLPTLARRDPKPVLFAKVPPLQKLLAKIGAAVADDPAVRGMVSFIEARAKAGAAESHLPDVSAFSVLVGRSISTLSPESLFPLVDILRCGLVDPRLSGCVAEEAGHKTIMSLLSHVSGLGEGCPYPLRLVTLQMACNLFSSPLYWDQILGFEPLRTLVVQLISSSFLDDTHSSVRVAAASVLFNVAVVNGRPRRRRQEEPGQDATSSTASGADGEELLPEDDQVELAASVLEAISQETQSREGLEGMLLALGHLLYLLPAESELGDLMKTLDAQATVLKAKESFKDISLIDEIGSALLGSLSKPRP